MLAGTAPACAVDPAEVAPGEDISVTASGLPVDASADVFFGGEEVASGVSDATGALELTAPLPIDAPPGPLASATGWDDNGPLPPCWMPFGELRGPVTDINLEEYQLAVMGTWIALPREVPADTIPDDTLGVAFSGVSPSGVVVLKSEVFERSVLFTVATPKSMS